MDAERSRQEDILDLVSAWMITKDDDQRGRELVERGLLAIDTYH